MFADERYEYILKALRETGSVLCAELANKFDVSGETIRRDLAFLEGQRLLKRVYGGAVKISQSQGFDELDKRTEINIDKKKSLSRAAAKFVNEDDVIAIDSGSTANEFAKVLARDFERLTVVTYSLDIFELLREKEGFELIIAGGKYIRGERVFNGVTTSESLMCRHVSKSFVVPSSVSLDFGVTITLPEFYTLEKTLFEICDSKVILADSTKFDSASKLRLCSIDDINLLVTDDELPEDIYKNYLNAGVNIVKANKQEEKV